VASQGELLQLVLSLLAQAANSRQVLNELTRKLIGLAEHAFSLRDASTLEEASLVLMNLPIDKARQIGTYYQALALSTKRKRSEALTLLEEVIDNVPLAYTARTLLASGAIHHYKGQIDDALRFYKEAILTALPEYGHDLQTTLVSCLNISAIKSLNDNHREALTDLEKLAPVMLMVAKQSPLYYYYYHADLAYELSQVGRLAEAEAACAVALASPFAHAYPEWSETRDEIAAKRQSASPSIAAINGLPTTNASPQIEQERKPESSIAPAFYWPAGEKFFLQRASIAIAAKTAIACFRIIKRTLERVRLSLGPRAPPVRF
jgi:tetratricopeptide (TPR) repeat protein